MPFRERGLGREWIIVWAANRFVLALTCASDLKVNQYFVQSVIAFDQRSTWCPRVPLIIRSSARR